MNLKYQIACKYSLFLNSDSINSFNNKCIVMLNLLIGILQQSKYCSFFFGNQSYLLLFFFTQFQTEMKNKIYRKQLFSAALTYNKSILHKLRRTIVVIDMVPNDDQSEINIQISELLVNRNRTKFRKYNVCKKYSICFYFHFLAFGIEFIENNLDFIIGLSILLLIFLLTLIVWIWHLCQRTGKNKKNDDKKESPTTEPNIGTEFIERRLSQSVDQQRLINQ